MQQPASQIPAPPITARWTARFLCRPETRRLPVCADVHTIMTRLRDARARSGLATPRLQHALRFSRTCRQRCHSASLLAPNEPAWPFTQCAAAPPPHTLPLNSNLSVSLSPTLEARPDLLHARPRPVLLQGKQREIRRQKPPRRLCPLPRVRQDGHELASGVEDARGRGGHGRVAVAGARGAAERALLRGEGGDRLLKKGEKEERCFFFFLSFLRGKGE